MRPLILYVDTEHERVADDPNMGPAHRAKIEATRDRLMTTANVTCRVVQYTDLSVRSIADSGAAGIIIGGNTTDWSAFDPVDLAGLLDAIRAAPRPILGICAGHQLIGRAHGASWGPLGPLAAGEVDPDPRFAPDQRKERGFLPVSLDRACPLFAGLGKRESFFQSHYWHLASVPDGFTNRAGSAWSAIQAIERRDRPVFGVQFHPERYDEDHPAGAHILRAFALLCRDGPAD